MRPLPAWLAVPLLVAALAGCANPGEPPADAADEASVITDPRDTSYLQNGSMAAGSHIHDYWGGRDRVQVLQDDGDLWSSCSGGGCADGMFAGFARPDEGIIVPQGTKWVNGTFNFTADGAQDFTKLELWVKTAMDSEAKPFATLVPGQPFSFESSQDQNDPPHYVLSLWEFRVMAFGSADSVEIKGSYEWSVEAVRGLPLVPYPPHPDRWEGKTELLLLEDEASALLYQETDHSRSCYVATGRCPGAHDLPDGVVVPFDTSRLEVRIGGVFPTLSLSFHGADTWNLTAVEGTMGTAELVFDVPLGPGVPDSPYAKQSLWSFVVGLDQPQPGDQTWTGTYTITVRAFKE
jgi:hypothetical protein